MDNFFTENSYRIEHIPRTVTFGDAFSSKYHPCRVDRRDVNEIMLDEDRLITLET